MSEKFPIAPEPGDDWIEPEDVTFAVNQAGDCVLTFIGPNKRRVSVALTSEDVDVLVNTLLRRKDLLSDAASDHKKKSH